jgi:hypothetical protein
MFPRLTSLDLRRQTTARILTACPAASISLLSQLWLPATVDDDLIPTLCQLPALRRLFLRGSKVTDAGLAALSEMARLIELDVSGCAVSDWGLEAVAALAPNLRSLAVAELSLLTSEGLRALSPLSQLRTIDVSGCENVCDTAIAVLVTSIPSLTSLDVSACWQVSRPVELIRSLYGTRNSMHSTKLGN